MQEILMGIAKLFAITTIRYVVIAGLAFLIFYKLFSSRFIKNKIQRRLAGNSDFQHEVLHSLISGLVFAIIGYVLFFTPLKEHTLFYTDLSRYAWWWLPVSVVLSLIIHDTYFYWMHRLLHHKKIFRLVHLVHHKSTNPSPWASYSFHFLESIVEGAVLVLLAFVLPMHSLAVLLFIIIGFIINVYGHLGYEIMPKSLRRSFLFEIINTSVHHNLHHSKFKGNYGLYFRIWDRLLKTEHPDYVKEYDRIQQQRFGTNAPPQEQQMKNKEAA